MMFYHLLLWLGITTHKVHIVKPIVTPISTIAPEKIESDIKERIIYHEIPYIPRLSPEGTTASSIAPKPTILPSTPGLTQEQINAIPTQYIINKTPGYHTEPIDVSGFGGHLINVPWNPDSTSTTTIKSVPPSPWKH